MVKSKLNKRDYLLLEILDKNARTSLKDISKELKISKQAVKKKIDKLDEKVILKYVSIIDFFKIGYNNVHLYLKVRGFSKEEYEKKIQKLIEIENITWVAEFFGDLNIGISIFYKNVFELNKTLIEVYRLFGKGIGGKKMHFVNRHLIQNISFFNKSPRKVINLSNDCCLNELKKTEKELLSEIRDNSRFSYLDLSKKLSKKAETIKKHIKKMEDKEIIKGYKLLIDYNQLGFIWSICNISISPGGKIENILETLRLEKRIPFISVTIENNLIIDFLSKDYRELKDFLLTLKEKNKMISDYSVLNVEKILKLEEI